MTKTYKTAKSFRVALEQRLAKAAEKESTDIPRLRRQVAFDRLLARLFSKSPAPWILKGGYAMQLRTENARATRDIDLAMKEAKFFSKNEDEQIAIISVFHAAVLNPIHFVSFKPPSNSSSTFFQ